jgi:hypothetical protein
MVTVLLICVYPGLMKSLPTGYKLGIEDGDNDKLKYPTLTLVIRTLYPRRSSKGLSDIHPRRPRFTRITEL